MNCKDTLFINCEYCGKEFVRKSTCQIYCSPKCRSTHHNNLKKQYSKKKKHHRSELPYEPKNSTLCWKCQNATGGCSWSSDFTPVEGWNAMPTRIRQSKGYKDTDSYIVKKCPQFVPDEE